MLRAYDLAGLADHLHRRGLYKGLFEQIMSISSTPAYDKLSPLAAVQTWAPGTEYVTLNPKASKPTQPLTHLP